MQLCLVIGLLVLTFFGFSVPKLNPTKSQPTLSVVEPEGKAAASIRTDVAWVGPNQTFHIIVSIEPVNGWHFYWKNPGTSGAPTEFDVQSPDNFTVGDIIYPRPISFYSEEGVTHGYKEIAAFFIPVTAPEELTDGEIKITVDVYWLACKSNCVRGTQTLTISIKTKTEEGPQYKDMVLQQFQSALPKPIETLEHTSVVFSENAIHITGSATQKSITFIGESAKGAKYYLERIKLIRKQNNFHLTIPVKLNFDNAGSHIIDLEGLLLFGKNKTDPSYVIQKQIVK